jgi:tripartite-type tricarboxylate transporter receptor subunit TctC
MGDTPMKIPTRRSALAFGLVVACLAGAPAFAADFYEGKRINLIVGADAGGGHDLYARLIARHMPKYIPGKPTIVVQNMPGAGSAKAAEYLATTAPKDGTAFGAIFPGAIIGPLLDEQMKVRYDPKQLVYIGTADSGTRVCATYRTSQSKTFEDAKSRKTIVGASAAGGSTRDYPLFLNSLAGTNFDVISGYKGTADITLAMERGEVDGICGLEWSSLKVQKADWVRDGKLNILVQMGLDPEQELTGLKVPPMWNFVPAENRAVVELIVAQQVFGRPYIAVPGTPAEQVKTLRDAFMATMADKEFLAEAEKSEMGITPLSGTDVQNLVTKLYASPPDIVERARKAMKPAG